MKTSIQNLDKQIKITVIFEGEQWADALTDVLAEKAKDITVEGYAKGEAPLSRVKGQLGSALYYEASNKLLDQNFQDIMSQVQEPVVDVNVSVSRFTDSFVELIVTCDKEPEVTLSQYKGLAVVKPAIAEVTEEDIANRLKQLQNNYAYFEMKDFDAVVEMGDTATIDYEGFKDGVPFAGGKANGYDLAIGSHSFIPGFEEGLVGMKIEETRDIPLTFPKEYHSPELAGADVVFTVTVHGIKTRKLPEIDDNLALDAGISDVSTLEELKAHLKENIIQEREQQADEQFTQLIVDELIALNDVELPENMIETQIKQMIEQYTMQLQQQGLSLSQVLQFNNMDAQAFKDSVREPAINNLKSGLILRAIIKAENIIVSEEEIDAALTKMADDYRMTLAQFKEAVGNSLDQYRHNLMQETAYNKAIQLLKDFAELKN